jgi:hypothetical protein
MVRRSSAWGASDELRWGTEPQRTPRARTPLQHRFDAHPRAHSERVHHTCHALKRSVALVIESPPWRFGCIVGRAMAPGDEPMGCLI